MVLNKEGICTNNIRWISLVVFLAFHGVREVSGATVDTTNVNIYTYGADDPGYGRSTISKINVFGMKNLKQVYEYKTRENPKHGFLIVVINKYSGLVEFESSFDTIATNSPDIKKMIVFLNQIPPERVVFGVVYKDGSIATKGNKPVLDAFQRLLGEPMKTLYFGGGYFFEGCTTLRDQLVRTSFQMAFQRKRGPGIYQSRVVATPLEIKIDLSSLGCDDPGPHRQAGKSCADAINSIKVNKVEYSRSNFGLNIAFLSRELGHVFAATTFDFSQSSQVESKFAKFVYSAPANTIVLGSVKGDASKNFGKTGQAALNHLLSRTVPSFQFRGAYAFIGVNSPTIDFIREAMRLRRFAIASRHLGGVTLSNNLRVHPEIQVELISTSCKNAKVNQALTSHTCPHETPVSIKINNEVPVSVKSKLDGRGFIFAVVNAASGRVDRVVNADTHGTEVELATVLKNTAKPSILLGVVKDDAFFRLSKGSLKYLKNVWIGEPIALEAVFDAYAFIGSNSDLKQTWVIQKRAPTENGTVTLTATIPLSIRECANPESPEHGETDQRLYSYGENARYKCYSKLPLLGEPAKCSVDGSWQVSAENPPKCPPDPDECADGTAKCPQHSSCRNLLGSYECVCHPGYSKELGDHCIYLNVCNDSQCLIPGTKCGIVEGRHECVCHEGFKMQNGSCKDINECHDSFRCPNNGICLNTIGSYQCKECKTGFQADINQASCIDTDECRTEVCNKNQSCHNSVGSYLCLCLSGFKMNSNGICEDIDECIEHQLLCPSSAKCVNTIGHFDCVCEQGLLEIRHSCVSPFLIGGIVSGIIVLGSLGIALSWFVHRWRTLKGRRLLEGLGSNEDINHELDPEDYFEASNNFVE